MLISVVTVCRNAAADLERTLRSVVEQTSHDIEHIVIDGASTDSTPEVLRRYRRSGLTWISEPDRGIYDAMNKGTRLATGEWVIFMNAGDTFAAADTVGRAEKVLAEVSADTGVVYGDVVKLGEIKRAGEPRDCHRMFFCHQSVFNRRSVLLSHPYDISHPLSADFKLYKTLIREGIGFMHIDFPVADFDTGGISNRRRSLGLADNMRVILETDGLIGGFRHMLHLFPAYISCRLRGK